MERIKETIRDFNGYLASLKKDADEVYLKVCDYFLKLKDTQAIIREMNVPTFSDRMKIAIERSYAYDDGNNEKARTFVNIF